VPSWYVGNARVTELGQVAATRSAGLKGSGDEERRRADRINTAWVCSAPIDIALNAG